MLNVSNEARVMLKKMLVAEISTYADSYPKMLDEYTFAIMLYESKNEGTDWELFASAASKEMPENSFVISSGIQFHHSTIQSVKARIEYIDGKFVINGQNVRLLTRQERGKQ